VQVQNAIEIAWNPSAAHNLKAQAFEFLNELRANPSAWQICLSLFTREPRLTDVVRHVSLEVINNSIQQQQLDTQNLIFARDSLLEYVRRNYNGATEQSSIDSSTIQNKIAQTLTLLFTSLYASGWETFFSDLRGLADNEAQTSSSSFPGTLLYLRVLATVHDEIADVLVQNRPDQQKRYQDLKDLIRVRDAGIIAASWENMLARSQQLGTHITEMCLKVVSRWVGWTEISLIVNEAIIGHLFRIAGGQEGDSAQGNQPRIRDAAIDVFTEIIAKKMKPNEKVDLIRFLNLESVVGQLLTSSSLATDRGTPAYDTDMAETVAKLVNNVVLDIVKVLDTNNVENQTREQAEQLLQAFVPYLLRLFADEYDEICSTVIPALTDLLTWFRRLAKQRGSVPEQFAGMIAPILDAVVAKMRYDDTSSWGEEDDQTDEAEFQELRKRLKTLQQILATTNESLYLSTLSNIVQTIFLKLTSGGVNVNWRDLDLALHELYLLGELGVRNGGLYQKKVPSSDAAERMIQLMSVMISSGESRIALSCKVFLTDIDIASFPHPAVHLQYMEICVRYCSFFEQNADFVTKVLENFVRYAHSTNLKVRARSWHLFLRYVRQLKGQLGNLSGTVVGAIADLLVINAEVSEDSGNDDMSSNQNSQSADMLFNSQLFLFEAVGCMASASSISTENKVLMASSVLNPLSTTIQHNIQDALRGDERALLQIHHSVMAIGTLARGFSDWVPGVAAIPVPEQVSLEFLGACNTILASLGLLKGSMTVRTAARFAFARMIGVLGFKVLEQLPQWIDGFLAESSTRDEMATFLRLLDQVIFGFKTQMYSILDTLLTPLLQRIFSGFSEQVTGTDDEIQLGELRREYLNFLLVLLNNNLESVLVSSTNQANFETIISTIEHFAKDTSEHPDSKLATSVLTKMTGVWGGPNIPNPATNTLAPNPVLPGFDRFMITRFSSITWALMTSPNFDPKDAQANRVVGEIAILQQAILAKTGREYLNWLKDSELRNLGIPDAAIEEYLRALTTTDAKNFKQILLRFLSQHKA